MVRLKSVEEGINGIEIDLSADTPTVEARPTVGRKPKRKA